MKILLVQSYLGPSEPPVFPLGLASLKAALAGHEVLVFDMNRDDDPFANLAKTIREFGPELVGVSLRNIDSTNKREVVFYYENLKPTVDVIREETDVPLVIGGSGFSMFAQEIMEDEPRLDFGIHLEGENTFPALIGNLDTPENIPSLFIREGDTVKYTGAGTPVDTAPLVGADHTAAPLENYTTFRDAVGVETKRGCALNCIYCIYGFLNGRDYRLRDPKKVVDEIERLAQNCEVRRFTFVDSVFNIPADHAETICRDLAARNLDIKWSAWFSEKTLTPEFANIAKSAGCDTFIFSPDAYTDSVLEKLGKNVTNADIRRGFDIIAAIPDVEVAYNFFKNPPGQTLSNFLGMIWFCVKAKLRLKNRVHFEFSSLRVEPHTRLREIALEEGVVDANDPLLKPKYYVNRRTRWIDALFNAVLRLKGK